MDSEKKPGFTPGPWRWEDGDDDGDGQGDSLNGPDGHEVVVTDHGVYPPHGADRHLISAAPDLYAALYSALEEFDSCAETETALMAEMRAALAKARGKP